MQIEGSQPQSSINTKQPLTQVPSNQPLGKEEFLKLLVTQLRYQNPLEPLKNEEFIAQTAQFSALEQMQELNRTLLDQNALQRSISNAMAVQYVGKIVEASGTKFNLTEGTLAKFGAKLTESADVQFTIFDAGGNLVSTLDLGTQNAKTVRAEWDGLGSNGQSLPDGIYTFKIQATNKTGEAVSVTPVMIGQVSGVTYEDGQAFLSVNEELISLRDIFSASLP